MIVALSGPSGIGKGYIKESLRTKHPCIEEIVWYTTRALRPDELMNANREHISEDDLGILSEKGEVALLQGIFGHRYAVRKQDILPREGFFLTEIHPFVIEEAKAINPDIITIGLVTDDYDLLRERLADRRKTESIDEIERRVRLAREEVNTIRGKTNYYDYLITIKRDNEDQIAGIAQNLFADFERGKEYVADKCRNNNT